MNYAAPGVAVPGVGTRSPLGLSDSKAEDHEERKEEDRPPFTLPVESSTTTSADSTPLQTPTQDPEDLGDLLQGTGPTHDAEVNILMHDGDEERWSLRRKVAEPIQDVAEAPSAKQDTKAESLLEETGTGRGSSLEDSTPTPTPDMVGLGFGIEMGTSPPFSLLAGLEGRLSSMGSPVAISMPGMGRRQSSSPIHQSPGPGPTPGQSSSPGVNQLMPPQRRRHSHGHAQPVPAFSIGRTSSSTSSPPGTRSGSGSGSGSGSDSTTTARAKWSVTSGMKTQQSQWKVHSPQPWPLPPQGRVTSPPPQVSSPLATTILTEDEEAITRRPSPSFPLRQLLPRNSSLLQESLPPQNVPTEQPPLSPPDDALYHAFVRKWCFASGPGPTVSGPVGGNGKGTEAGVTVR